MFSVLKKYGLKIALSNIWLRVRNWADRTEIWPFCVLVCAVLLSVWAIFMALSIVELITIKNYECPAIHRIILVAEARELTIEDLIVSMAKEGGVSPTTALRIAKCESSLNPNARNKHSSAKGLYQFLDGTWKNYCEGDVFNPEDSIKCFIKLYPTHPTWWECK